MFWLTRFEEHELEGWFGKGNQHFPVLWIAASAVVVVVAILLLWFSSLDRSHENVS